MVKELVIIGCGGLGREVLQYVDDINRVAPAYRVLGYIDDDLSLWQTNVNGVRVLGGTEALRTLRQKGTLFAFCAIASPRAKADKAALLKSLDIETVNIIHPTAYLPPSAALGTNVLVGPLCVLTTGLAVGDYVHINPQCGIGHDARIGDYTTLYWNVNVSGGVRIGARCEIGTKTFIKQQTVLGDGVITGAGAVVVAGVADGATVVGVPARTR